MSGITISGLTSKSTVQELFSAISPILMTTTAPTTTMSAAAKAAANKAAANAMAQMKAANKAAANKAAANRARMLDPTFYNPLLRKGGTYKKSRRSKRNSSRRSR